MNRPEAIEWHLGHMARDASTGKHSEWSVGAPVSADVVQEHQRHANFLIALFSESPYSGLEKRYLELKTVLTSLQNPHTKNGTLPYLGNEIRTRLDDLLSALRAFDDRTSHDLKKSFGENSEPFRTFKEALSHEYDNEFAYRFMFKLRNYSQHCGQPEMAGQVRSSRAADGTTVRLASLAFDSRELLRRFNKWGTQVKEELKEIDGRFEVEPIVDRLMFSCGQAYSKMLVSQESAIRSASAFIRTCDRRPDGIDALPCFFGLERGQGIKSGTTDWSVKFVLLEIANHAEVTLNSAKAVTGGNC
ncbi:hypothetical protein [Streptomyces hokutonensis]|uniref:hypothetical protein n=1 Tax=Streptomyces hokutonensis TaxID=1306990 RepID=UPI0036C80063